MYSSVFTSLQQRLQEVLQTVGNTSHHIAGVAVLGEKKGKLKIWVLLQLNLPSITPGQLVSRVFCHCHHVVDQLLQIQKQHACQSVSRLMNSNHAARVRLTGGM